MHWGDALECSGRRQTHRHACHAEASRARAPRRASKPCPPRRQPAGASWSSCVLEFTSCLHCNPAATVECDTLQSHRGAPGEAVRARVRATDWPHAAHLRVPLAWQPAPQRAPRGVPCAGRAASRLPEPYGSWRCVDGIARGHGPRSRQNAALRSRTATFAFASYAPRCGGVRPCWNKPNVQPSPLHTLAPSPSLNRCNLHLSHSHDIGLMLDLSLAPAART